MRNWKISLEDRDEVPLLAVVLTAQAAWKRLTPIQRAAVKAAYPDGAVVAAQVTLRALDRHGFLESGDTLTDAGKAVVRWSVKP